nr:hypothetical protein CFP56_38949 [Quercus suber]
MAPALTEQRLASEVFSYDKPSKTIFPDGIKTSGQRSPDYQLLKAYEQFPKEITGPTVWRPEDYKNNPETWVHPFSDDEVAEMSKAADDFMASATPLTGITKVSIFRLHRCYVVSRQF